MLERLEYLLCYDELDLDQEWDPTLDSCFSNELQFGTIK